MHGLWSQLSLISKPSFPLLIRLRIFLGFHLFICTMRTIVIPTLDLWFWGLNGYICNTCKWTNTVIDITVFVIKTSTSGFPSGSVVRNLPANAGDMSSILDLGKPTCQRATKSMHHNSWACALGPASHNYWSPHSAYKPISHNYWAHVSQLLSLHTSEPVFCNRRSHHCERPVHPN